MRMSPEKKFILRKTGYAVGSVIGLIYQMYYICEAFFAYSVITDFNVGRSEFIKPPNMALCFDPSKVRQPTDFQEIGSLEGTNVDTILAKAPKGFDNNVFFAYENPTNSFYIEADGFSNLSSIGISSRIRVRRFTKSRQVCYGFELTKDPEFSRSFIVDRKRTTIMYKLRYWNYWFENMETFKVMFYDRDTIGYLEREDTGLAITRELEQDQEIDSEGKPITWPNGTEKMQRLTFNETIEGKMVNVLSQQPVVIKVTYTKHGSKLLAAPYSSDCRHYDRNMCFYTCALELFNTRPYESFDMYHESGSKPLLLLKDIEKNETLKEELLNKSMSCSDRCRRPSCFSTEYVPKGVSMVNALNGSATDFSLNLPVDPDFEIHTKPLVNMIDFVTYVLSCISFWLGFAPYEFLSEYDPLTSGYHYVKRRAKGEVVVKKKPLTRSQMLATKIKSLDIESSEYSLRLFIFLLQAWFDQVKIEMEMLLKQTHRANNVEDAKEITDGQVDHREKSAKIAVINRQSLINERQVKSAGVTKSRQALPKQDSIASSAANKGEGSY